MPAPGHKLTSRLAWHNDRCTPDSCRLVVLPRSAALGQGTDILSRFRVEQRGCRRPANNPKNQSDAWLAHSVDCGGAGPSGKRKASQRGHVLAPQVGLIVTGD